MSRQLRFCPQCARPLGRGASEDGVERLRCLEPSCGFVHWDNPVPVVAAVVEHRGDVILARNKLWPSGMFGLITGFLERHDPNPASGVLREVEEELGLQGKVEGFIGHYPFTRMNQLIIAYHVTADGPIELGEELAEYKRVPPDQLKPWAGSTGDAVRDWLLARGFTPPAPEARLYDIAGYAGIDAQLATAGQPTAEQFALVRGAGFDTVINLALPTSPGALDDEAALVRSLGMRYRHLPVNFDAPQPSDFEQFCTLMQAERGRKVFVHCAANKRASVFVYLWRRLVRGESEAAARMQLERVWTPDAVWSAFIDRQIGAANDTG